MMLIPEREGEKTLAIHVLVGPLLSLLAAEQGLGANNGPSCPTPSPSDQVLAPPAGEPVDHHP